MPWPSPPLLPSRSCASSRHRQLNAGRCHSTSRHWTAAWAEACGPERCMRWRQTPPRLPTMPPQHCSLPGSLHARRAASARLCSGSAAATISTRPGWPRPGYVRPTSFTRNRATMRRCLPWSRMRYATARRRPSSRKPARCRWSRRAACSWSRPKPIFRCCCCGGSAAGQVTRLRSLRRPGRAGASAARRLRGWQLPALDVRAGRSSSSGSATASHFP